jgi:integrase
LVPSGVATSTRKEVEVMVKSIATPAPRKPAKPSPNFPLFAHATRRWAKKVRGKMYYFGPWDQPEQALALWNQQKDDLLAGRSTRVFDAAAKKPKAGKPRRPKGFPLFAHATGRWAKKIRGKLYYFGPWAEPQKALESWLDQKDDLLAGRTPRTTSADGLTVHELANRFLTSKRMQVDVGELTPRSWSDYQTVCTRLISTLGRRRLVDDLAADDFVRLRRDIAETRSAVAVGNEVQRVRTVFKYGYEAGLIEKPVRFGPAFKKPSAKVLREQRNAKGLRMFEAAELRNVINAAGVPLKAMILLGINCGFGNHDCGTLPISAVDLKSGWINYPRPKAAIQRRCWLWPETVKALKAALADRPEPKDRGDAGLMFVTRFGTPWAKVAELPSADVSEKKAPAVDNPITKEFRKLLDKLKLYRPGLGFYCLRRGFETIAGDSRDQVAVDAVMGHAPRANDMASVYRQRIDDERLRAVAEHVRQWLFGKGKKAKPK